MRLPSITQPVMLRQLGRLVQVFGKPKEARDVEQMAAAYRDALEGIDEGELEAAVKMTLREEKYFPRPSVLRRHALDHRELARRHDKQAQVAEDLCSQCGHHYWYAGFELPNGMVAPRLRCRCRETSKGWNTERALAWTEDDPKLIHAGYVPPLEESAA